MSNESDIKNELRMMSNEIDIKNELRLNPEQLAIFAEAIFTPDLTEVHGLPANATSLEVRSYPGKGNIVIVTTPNGVDKFCLIFDLPGEGKGVFAQRIGRTRMINVENNESEGE